MASLLALSRAASEEAKRSLGFTVWAHGVGLMFAIVATQFVAPWSHVFAVIALLAECVAWILKHRAEETHQSAEHARRSAMLMWAFGATTEPPDAVDLRAGFSGDVEARAVALEDPNYYASVRPPGRNRFVEMFQESVFWSKHLYGMAGRITLWSCAALTFGTVVLFVILAPSSASSLLTLLAQLMVPIVTAFVSLDLLGLGLGWLAASRTSRRIDQAMQRVEDPSEEALLATYAEYAVATASASPIPTIFYSREHDRLNREWRRRRGG